MLMLWEPESEALPQPELKLVRRAMAEWVGPRTSGRGWPDYALTLAARGCGVVCVLGCPTPILCQQGSLILAVFNFSVFVFVFFLMCMYFACMSIVHCVRTACLRRPEEGI